MGYSLPGSSVHGISQARILERVAISSSRGSSWPRDETHFYVACIAGGFFTLWAIKEAHMEYYSSFKKESLQYDEPWEHYAKRNKPVTRQKQPFH